MQTPSMTTQQQTQSKESEIDPIDQAWTNFHDQDTPETRKALLYRTGLQACPTRL